MDDLTTKFLTEMATILIPALLSIIVALTSLGLHKLNLYVQTKIGASNLDEAKRMAATIVRAVEQSPVFKNYDGAGKKEAALMKFLAWADKRGIKMEYHELDDMIEAAVQEMNSELIDLVPVGAEG